MATATAKTEIIADNSDNNKEIVEDILMKKLVKNPSDYTKDLYSF